MEEFLPLKEYYGLGLFKLDWRKQSKMSAEQNSCVLIGREMACII